MVKCEKKMVENNDFDLFFGNSHDFFFKKFKNVLKLGFEFCQFSYREAKINFKFFLKSGLKNCVGRKIRVLPKHV